MGKYLRTSMLRCVNATAVASGCASATGTVADEQKEACVEESECSYHWKQMRELAD